MKEGLQTNRLTRYGSQTNKYFKAEDVYFRVMNYRIHVVITGDNMDYGDAKVQDRILKLLDDITNLPLISGEKALREDFLSLYRKRCKKRRRSNFKTNLLTCLDRYASKTPFRSNVKLSEDRSMRFGCQGKFPALYVIHDTQVSYPSSNACIIDDGTWFYQPSSIYHIYK